MNKIEIIAELAQGFEGNSMKARLLIQAAAAAGADAAKFQMVYSDELATSDYKYYDLFKSLEMKDEEWKDLAIYASGLGISLYTDIFGIRSLSLSEEINIPCVKIHGTDIANEFLLRSVASSSIPKVILGAGGAFLNEIEVDAVIIATPEWVRREPIQATIDAGKAILIEKPFAESWDEAKQLHKILRSYPHVIQFCHVLRFSPRFFAMKKMVSEGYVGDIRHMHGCRNSNNQRVKRVLGKANLAFWLTPHDVDIMRWLNESEVNSVYTLSRGELDTADDYIVSLLRFENGATATHEVSWCTPPLSAAAREAFFQVRGTGGAIELDDFATNISVC
jgi:N,N'-diacetyllegionaminate synthase